MKYSLFAFVFLATMAFSCGAPSSSAGTESDSGIAFKHVTVKDALKMAAEQNKLVFIDAYTTWCGPCKKMARTTFKDAKVAAYFNENFINLKVDMEKSEGLKLERKYGIQSYPTLLFLDGSGKEVKKAIGYHQSGEFLRLAKRAQAKK